MNAYTQTKTQAAYVIFLPLPLPSFFAAALLALFLPWSPACIAFFLLLLQTIEYPGN